MGSYVDTYVVECACIYKQLCITFRRTAGLISIVYKPSHIIILMNRYRQKTL